jgi:hypothetical protein
VPSSDSPATPETLKGLRGALAGLVEPEQPGIVLQTGHQRIDLERELDGVGVGAQVSCGHGLRHRFLQFTAPISLLPDHSIVQCTISSTVFAGGAGQNTATVVFVRPLEPVRDDAAVVEDQVAGGSTLATERARTKAERADATWSTRSTPPRYRYHGRAMR